MLSVRTTGFSHPFCGGGGGGEGVNIHAGEGGIVNTTKRNDFRIIFLFLKVRHQKSEESG